MGSALTAAGLALAAGDTWLLVVSWRSRTALAAVVAAAGVLAALLGAAPALAHAERRAAVAGAGVSLVMASVLYRIGQAVQHLLDEDPDAEGAAERQQRM